ncbi:hypothetical protein ES703_88708 [subsurface metagenome]
MLRKFLWTAGVAVGVFGLCLGLGVSGLLDAENTVGYYSAGVLYYTAFYLAPLAFLVGVIGSLVCVIKSRLGKTNVGHS